MVIMHVQMCKALFDTHTHTHALVYFEVVHGKYDPKL